MSTSPEADRARMHIAAYEAEANLARQWAAIRRAEAKSEDERAALLDGLAQQLRHRLKEASNG